MATKNWKYPVGDMVTWFAIAKNWRLLNGHKSADYRKSVATCLCYLHVAAKVCAARLPR